MPSGGLVRGLPFAVLVALGVLAVLAGMPTQDADSGEPVASSTGDPERTLTVPIEAVDCPEGYDNGAEDDVCLAYEGQIPGPTWVLEAGEHVEIELRHEVDSTLAGLDAPAEVQDALAEARYSLHRHGVSVAACDDGVSKPLGTHVCESSLGPSGAPEPSGSITYAFTAPFEGGWHYHDHAKGLDAGASLQPVLGEEAILRGLYGSFLVLGEDETRGEVFDLHLLDTGANGGLGLDGSVAEGERFDLLVVGLGNWAWDVSLEHDEAGTIEELEVGPGVARALTVDEAEPGTYTWTATSPQASQAYEGEVTVT